MKNSPGRWQKKQERRTEDSIEPPPERQCGLSLVALSRIVQCRDDWRRLMKRATAAQTEPSVLDNDDQSLTLLNRSCVAVFFMLVL